MVQDQEVADGDGILYAGPKKTNITRDESSRQVSKENRSSNEESGLNIEENGFECGGGKADLSFS